MKSRKEIENLFASIKDENYGIIEIHFDQKFHSYSLRIYNISNSDEKELGCDAFDEEIVKKFKFKKLLPFFDRNTQLNESKILNIILENKLYESIEMIDFIVDESIASYTSESCNQKLKDYEDLCKVIDDLQQDAKFKS
ncbi:MAG: hypothetical protein HUJ42_01460 [Malacoplasma sp.]|nr:hypothetical protein [Malacoplasma sp.]